MTNGEHLYNYRKDTEANIKSLTGSDIREGVFYFAKDTGKWFYGSPNSTKILGPIALGPSPNSDNDLDLDDGMLYISVRDSNVDDSVGLVGGGDQTLQDLLDALATAANQIPLTLAADKVLFGGSLDNITYETNFHWDSTSKRLGVNVPNPSNTLHVGGDVRINTLSTYSGATELITHQSNVIKKKKISDIKLTEFDDTGFDTIIPSNEIAYGTGTGITSDAGLKWNGTDILSVNGRMDVEGRLNVNGQAVLMRYGSTPFVIVDGNSSGVGSYAAYGNTGVNVTATGYRAAYLNEGANVTATGRESARDNTGANVTATGRESARDNTGDYVTATGRESARDNTGDYVTATGYRAAYGNTGANVTASGYYSAYQNTGANVTATGRESARDNTGANVTALGSLSAYQNTGANVTALGYLSAYQNTGANVTALGINAARLNEGDNNSMFGYQAGYVNLSTPLLGSLNTFIGAGATFDNQNIENSTALGSGVILTQSNSVILGNGADVGIRTNAPTEALDVNGEARIRNITTLSTNPTHLLTEDGGVVKKKGLSDIKLTDLNDDLSYDKYEYWNLKTNGVQRKQIGSKDEVDLIAGDNISLSYAANGKVTFDAEDTYTTAATLSGTTLRFDRTDGSNQYNVNLNSLKLIDLDDTGFSSSSTWRLKVNDTPIAGIGDGDEVNFIGGDGIRVTNPSGNNVNIEFDVCKGTINDRKSYMFQTTGASSYTVPHGLGSPFVIVQMWKYDNPDYTLDRSWTVKTDGPNDVVVSTQNLIPSGTRYVVNIIKIGCLN